MSNDPKILVEFSPEEITWLADRLHEFRDQVTNTTLRGAALAVDLPGAEERFRKALSSVDKHKQMEATIRNKLLDKAHDQGFGEL